jgi:hypothetical protein
LFCFAVVVVVMVVGGRNSPAATLERAFLLWCLSALRLSLCRDAELRFAPPPSTPTIPTTPPHAFRSCGASPYSHSTIGIDIRCNSSMVCILDPRTPPSASQRVGDVLLVQPCALYTRRQEVDKQLAPMARCGPPFPPPLPTGEVSRVTQRFCDRSQHLTVTTASVVGM